MYDQYSLRFSQNTSNRSKQTYVNSSFGNAPKLFSSQRFSSAVSSQQDQNKTSSERLKGLNLEIEGLLSKINAIKEEHSVRPKNDSSASESKFSRFPKFDPPVSTPKPVSSAKPFDFITEIKPFTPKALPKTDYFQNWSPNLSSSVKAQQKPFIPNTPNNTKFLFSQGLLNIPNLKASMDFQDDIAPHNFKKVKKLEDMVTKQSSEEDINLMMKSCIFQKKLTIKDFDLGKCVGSGKFGDVHICKHKLTGTLFAIKKIFKSEIKSYNMIEQFTRELKIHYRLNHPNLIKLYTHFDDEYHLFLLMEYCEGGVLMDKLKCTEKAASRYIGETINAISYLHNLKIAHRDIKPENIVLQFNTVKVCDFGWSSFYENEMKTTFCGTLDYLSPEMKDRGIYDNSVDVWSIGVLTYELLTGNAPYKNQLLAWKNKGQQKSKINWEVKYPSDVSEVAESFMKGLLKVNPDERANLRQCANHTFIRRYKEQPEFSEYFLEISFLFM